MQEPHWDDLKVFLAVAREESLSGAGRILRIDPATVGRRIARLEQALDAPLFVKSPQGYALSAAGERLLSHSEAAEQAMRAGVEALAGPSESLTGQIRIGAPDGCANYLLPQVCARIGAENPDLDIHIVSFTNSGCGIIECCLWSRFHNNSSDLVGPVGTTSQFWSHRIGYRYSRI